MDRYKRQLFGRNEYEDYEEVENERREWKEKVLDEILDLYKEACRENNEEKAAWYMAEYINVSAYNTNIHYYD